MVISFQTVLTEYRDLPLFTQFWFIYVHLCSFGRLFTPHGKHVHIRVINLILIYFNISMLLIKIFRRLVIAKYCVYG